MNRWDCRDQGDELNNTWVDRPITMIQSLSILSLFPSFNIPPALKKESGLVLEILSMLDGKRTVCGMQVLFHPVIVC